MYGSQVLDKDWRAIDILYDDILDLFYIVNQADTPHDIGLRAFRDHVAAYVDITFCDSVIKFQGRYPVTDQLIRVDANLESLYFSSEADDIRYTGYSPQLPLDHPILQGLQFPDGTLIAT